LAEVDVGLRRLRLEPTHFDHYFSSAVIVNRSQAMFVPQRKKPLKSMLTAA
jgi:hypothetical protein